MSLMIMARRMLGISLTTGALALTLGAAGCSGDTGQASSNGPASAAPQGVDKGAFAFPTSVAGYGNCTGAYCTNLARACDDVVRSGCGKASYPYEGEAPGTGKGSEAFRKAVSACASVADSMLGEKVSEDGGGDAKKERVLKSFLAGRIAACTRHASSCQPMADCLRGMYVPKPLPEEKAANLPELPPPPQTIEPKFWEKAYKGPRAEAVELPPWGKEVHLAAADSPSCAKCAIERCTMFAYQCYGAAGTEDCKDGNCCHSMRSCIEECGGYDPYVSVSKFDECAARCQENRPDAAQQLTNLQQCAAVACKGCEDFDKVVQDSPKEGKL